MPFIPLTPEDEKHICSALGIRSADELFSSIPPSIRNHSAFKIDPGHGYDSSGRGLTEHELRKYFGALAAKNWTATHFLGGGVYDNTIPALVNALVSRGEFLTCYTPYQPEMSQGTLQAIFEFQTMIGRMTAMPIANASMYDGATATAEAILMAQRLSPQDRQRAIVANSLHPDYRTVISTTLDGHSRPPVDLPCNPRGTVDIPKLQELIHEHSPAAVVVGYPNYFGIVEDLAQIRSHIPKETLLIVSMADPSALSIFEAPGNLGADIVVGEAHQFGTPMLFGGPHVGFFATRKEHLRQLPGRLCGQSADSKGNVAYTLTLATREQHIRREKATSNICTNQGLIALRTTIYLSFLGKQGFEKLGQTNHSLFQYLSKELSRAGIKSVFDALCYREGLFEVPNLSVRFQRAIDSGIVPGIRMEATNRLLIAVNPKHTKSDIDSLVEVLSHD